MVQEATQRSKQKTDRSTEFQPTHEDIAALAYALWQARHCPEGEGDADWFRAEQELIANRDAAAKALRG